MLLKFRDTMRDGGWKNKTVSDGFRVTKQAVRQRAVSEYQRAHNEKLSTPKRQAEKYEEKMRMTRSEFNKWFSKLFTNVFKTLF